MDEGTKNLLRARFEGADGGPCRWCGGLHQRECGRVKKIIFHPTTEDQIREIEFWADGEWDKSSVIWPEDIV